MTSAFPWDIVLEIFSYCSSSGFLVNKELTKISFKSKYRVIEVSDSLCMLEMDNSFLDYYSFVERLILYNVDPFVFDINLIKTKLFNLKSVYFDNSICSTSEIFIAKLTTFKCLTEISLINYNPKICIINQMPNITSFRLCSSLLECPKLESTSTPLIHIKHLWAAYQTQEDCNVLRLLFPNIKSLVVKSVQKSTLDLRAFLVEKLENGFDSIVPDTVKTLICEFQHEDCTTLPRDQSFTCVEFHLKDLNCFGYDPTWNSCIKYCRSVTWRCTIKVYDEFAISNSPLFPFNGAHHQVIDDLHCFYRILIDDPKDRNEKNKFYWSPFLRHEYLVHFKRYAPLNRLIKEIYQGMTRMSFLIVTIVQQPKNTMNTNKIQKYLFS